MAISVKEAAVRLGVSPSLVYALCASGRLNHYRVGVGRGTIRIEEADLAAVKQTVSGRPDAALPDTLRHLTLN